MQTWHIHIKGQVQGVGFRPFVYKLAHDFHFNGWVNNTIDGVHIEINALPNDVQQFSKKLIQHKPVLAQITDMQIQEVQQKFFDNFQIIHSDENGKRNLLLTPDAGICHDCRTDILAPSNRRKGYAFTTCTNCGPRYSIVKELPFDRIHTTMNTFHMCDNCLEEYRNPLDRRYFSQTNSCSQCGIQMQLFKSGGELISTNQEELLDMVIKFLEADKIIAIKGIGGYLLCCNANNSEAIQNLRERKKRPSKPFAIMCPNTEMIAQLAYLDPEVEKALDYPVSPVVLVDAKEEIERFIKFKSIAPGLTQIGVMLPYTPLFELLLNKLDKPIVATSGNVSGSPIIFSDKEALTQLTDIADYLLTNNRDIVGPQDDSVIKLSTFSKHPIIIRRSRGLAPTLIIPGLQVPRDRILAMGAMLKSTFTLLHEDNLYVSQYLGDLDHFDAQQNFDQVLSQFLKIFKAKPNLILTDKHHNYPSTRMGEMMAQSLSIPLKKVQHHKAHFAAILSEHLLHLQEEPVLGVIWDGTGLGDDDQIWGGEFFEYRNNQCFRPYHFSYFDFFLGDKMPKEPRISALSSCRHIEGAEKILAALFTKMEWSIYSKMLTQSQRLQTSSVGRLFDAVAALLNLKTKQSYEGEAAMLLEKQASSYIKVNGLENIGSYYTDYQLSPAIDHSILLKGVLSDIFRKKDVAEIAARFHMSLVHLIKQVADHLKIKKLAFSGGCFQNSLLVDLIIKHLGSNYELYFHQRLSPNDENVSFGQIMYELIFK